MFDLWLAIDRAFPDQARIIKHSVFSRHSFGCKSTMIFKIGSIAIKKNMDLLKVSSMYRVLHARYFHEITAWMSTFHSYASFQVCSLFRKKLRLFALRKSHGDVRFSFEYSFWGLHEVAGTRGFETSNFKISHATHRLLSNLSIYCSKFTINLEKTQFS